MRVEHDLYDAPEGEASYGPWSDEGAAEAAAAALEQVRSVQHVDLG